MSSIKDKPISAIKFRNYCKDNDISAKKLSKVLNISIKTIYCYWSGVFQVPDYAKKILEQELNMPIYEIFLNDSFDVEAIVTYRTRGA